MFLSAFAARSFTRRPRFCEALTPIAGVTLSVPCAPVLCGFATLEGDQLCSSPSPQEPCPAGNVHCEWGRLLPFVQHVIYYWPQVSGAGIGQEQVVKVWPLAGAEIAVKNGLHCHLVVLGAAIRGGVQGPPGAEVSPRKGDIR